MAYGDDGLVPVFTDRLGAGWRRGHAGWGLHAGGRPHVDFLLVDEADGGGGDVGGDDVLEVGGDVDHVGAVLAGAEDPVDFGGGGVVAADDLGGFGDAVEFASDEGEAVGAAEGAEVDGGEGGAVDEVEDSEGVEGSEAVVGDVGGGAVGGGDDFVGVGADGEFVEDLEGGGVDGGEGVVVLGECEQHGLRGRGDSEGAEESGGEERGFHGERVLLREGGGGEKVIGEVLRMAGCAGVLARFAWQLGWETAKVGTCSTRKLTPLPVLPRP